MLLLHAKCRASNACAAGVRELIAHLNFSLAHLFQVDGMRRMRAVVLNLHAACSTADAGTLQHAITAAEAIGLGTSDGMRRARAALLDVERLALASAAVDAAMTRGSDSQSYVEQVTHSDGRVCLPPLERSLEWLRSTHATSAVRCPTSKSLGTRA